MILNHSDIKVASEHSLAGCYNYAAGDNLTACRVLNRWTMFLDSRDVSLTPYLAMKGIHEPHILEAICGVVQPGMTCVDVGAGFGYHTLLLCELVQAHGRVYAFEPAPRIYPLLKRNIEINGFVKRARPYPNAIGETEGQGELAVHRYRFDSATLADRAKASFGQANIAAVHLSRLDDILIDNGPSPEFFLISVVGYEPQVWGGMKQLLHSKRKVTVLMEVTHRWHSNPGAFYDDLVDEGFVIHRLHEATREPLVSREQFTEEFRSWLLLTR